MGPLQVHGNIYEWTGNCDTKNTGERRPIVRPGYLRAASHLAYSVDTREVWLGFRVGRTLFDSLTRDASPLAQPCSRHVRARNRSCDAGPLDEWRPHCDAGALMNVHRAEVASLVAHYQIAAAPCPSRAFERALDSLLPPC
jgi:hypothetical protein